MSTGIILSLLPWISRVGTPLRPIAEIAARAGIDGQYIEPYGRYKAKVDPALLRESQVRDGKLVLVTAITPNIIMSSSRAPLWESCCFALRVVANSTHLRKSFHFLFL